MKNRKSRIRIALALMVSLFVLFSSMTVFAMAAESGTGTDNTEEEFTGLFHRNGGSVKGNCPSCGKDWNQYGPVDLYFENGELVRVIVHCGCGAVSSWLNRSNYGAKPNGGADNNIQLGGDKAVLESVSGGNTEPVDDTEDKTPSTGSNPDDGGTSNDDPKDDADQDDPDKDDPTKDDPETDDPDNDKPGDDELDLPEDDFPEDDLPEDETEESEIVTNSNPPAGRPRNNNNTSTGTTIETTDEPATAVVNTPAVETTAAQTTAATETLNRMPIPAAATSASPISLSLNEPVVPQASLPAWALMNLILMILTGLMSAALAFTYFGKGNDDNQKTNRKGILRLASLIPAIGAVVLFLLTENIRNPMILKDRWTVWMVIIVLVQVVWALFAAKSRRNNQFDDFEAQEI